MRFTIGVCLAASTIWAQQANAPAFEVASIKVSTEPPGHSGVHTNPGYLRIQNGSLKQCVMDAYGVQSFQVSGGPDWFELQRFEIDARTEGPADDDQLKLMLRTLLADRFRLAFHRENRPVMGYALVLAKGGLKIKPNEASGHHTTHHDRNAFTAQNMSMERLAATLSEVLRTPVADATGVPGDFDISLAWAPEELRARADGTGQPAPVPNASSVPTLPEVLQQQLGLKLEARKVNMEVLVIDRAEKPAEN